LGGGELQSNLSTLSAVLDNNSIQQIPSARVLAGVAAALRISDEEKELERGCGLQANKSIHTDLPDEKITEINSNEEKEQIPSKSAFSNESTLLYEEFKSTVSTSPLPQHASSTMIQKEEEEEVMIVETKVENQRRREESLAAVDSAIMVSLSGESSAAVDRLLRLRDALTELLSQGNILIFY